MSTSHDQKNQFDTATQLHLAGKLTEASALYLQILRADSNHADVLHQLGILHSQRGEFAQAISHLNRAILLDPQNAAYQMHFADALRDAGQLQEAIRHYRIAIALSPLVPLPVINLAKTFGLLQQNAEAITLYRKALTFKLDTPTETAVRNNLGLCLAHTHQFEQSLTELNASLQLTPNNPQALNHLAFLMVEQGSLTTAIRAADASLKIEPNSAVALNVRGLALKKMHRLDEAIESFQQAVNLKPDNPVFHANLANTLISRGKLYDAMDVAQKLVRVSPTFSGAHQILAGIYSDLGRFDECFAHFDQAISLTPLQHEPLQGKIFAQHFCQSQSTADLAHMQQIFHDRFERPLQAGVLKCDNDRSPDRKLRIGYLSPNFNNHVLALLMLPLLTHHDRQSVELWLYSDVAQAVPITERFQSLATRFRVVKGLSDEQVAHQIRVDKIDILIDLTMHMVDSRLLVFARRPAPVQVTWCYPGSTGMSSIDYRISDPYLDPPGMFEHFYSEKTVRLPDTFFCYDPMSEEPVSDPPFHKRGFITFGCLNNFCKVNAPQLQRWGRIMAAVPASHLLLLSPEGECRKHVEIELAKEGVSPDRIDHVSRCARPEYLKLYHQIDLVLDTLPYNGHTTTLDSLWMGVPLVTMTGHTVAGRAGFSELSNLGLTQWVADTPERYIELAVRLASDRQMLSELRSTLRPRMIASPLMDGPRFARNMEAAYRKMWQDWCAQQSD